MFEMDGKIGILVNVEIKQKRNLLVVSYFSCSSREPLLSRTKGRDQAHRGYTEIDRSRKLNVRRTRTRTTRHCPLAFQDTANISVGRKMFDRRKSYEKPKDTYNTYSRSIMREFLSTDQKRMISRTRIRIKCLRILHLKSTIKLMGDKYIYLMSAT